MPTYEYACRDCGEHLEVVQSFKDEPLTVCPACDGRLRKVFSAAPIVFKGSGWHITDYAPKRSAAAGDASGAKDAATGGSSGATTDGGTSDAGTSDAGSAEKRSA